MDSVSLDAYLLDAGRPPGAGGNWGSSCGGIKLIFGLFLLFLFVVSDVFVNNVVSGFGEKTVKCRSPTAWGTVLQGVFLVIGYIILLHLIDRQVL
jgi:hypothetical protein